MNASPAFKDLNSGEQAAIYHELRRSSGPVRTRFIIQTTVEVLVSLLVWLVWVGPALSGWRKFAAFVIFFSILYVSRSLVWRFLQVPAVERELQSRGQSPGEVLEKRETRLLAGNDPETW